MPAEKTPTRAHQWFLRIDRLPEVRLRAVAAVLAAVAVLSLILAMMVLDRVHDPWLRAPLFLVTGGLMSAAALGLGAAVYELRHRHATRAGRGAAASEDA